MFMFPHLWNSSFETKECLTFVKSCYREYIMFEHVFQQYRVMDTSSGNSWYIHKISLYQRCIYHKPKLYLRGKCWILGHIMMPCNVTPKWWWKRFLHLFTYGEFRFFQVFPCCFYFWVCDIHIIFSLKMYSWLKMLLRLNVGCWIGVGFFIIHRVVLICCWLGSTKKNAS